MNKKVEELLGGFDSKLVVWCVKYVHDLCTDDNGMIDMVTEQLQCSEVNLFDGFENVSQVMGFNLDEEREEIKTYEQFPHTITFEGSRYYKIAGTMGQSRGIDDIIAQRYTDDPTGNYNNNCPLYMDAKRNIMWD